MRVDEYGDPCEGRPRMHCYLCERGFLLDEAPNHRYCWDCWRAMTEEERNRIKKSINKELGWARYPDKKIQ